MADKQREKKYTNNYSQNRYKLKGAGDCESLLTKYPLLPVPTTGHSY
jgi:hypothetical protein